jgi:hypothetical protein
LQRHYRASHGHFEIDDHEGCRYLGSGWDPVWRGKNVVATRDEYVEWDAEANCGVGRDQLDRCGCYVSVVDVNQGDGGEARCTKTRLHRAGGYSSKDGRLDL